MVFMLQMCAGRTKSQGTERAQEDRAGLSVTPGQHSLPDPLRNVRCSRQRQQGVPGNGSEGEAVLRQKKTWFLVNKIVSLYTTLNALLALVHTRWTRGPGTPLSALTCGKIPRCCSPCLLPSSLWFSVNLRGLPVCTAWTGWREKRQGSRVPTQPYNTKDQWMWAEQTPKSSQ